MHGVESYSGWLRNFVIYYGSVSFGCMDKLCRQAVECRRGRGGQRQRNYGDTFHTMLQESTSKVLGTLYDFVKLWTPKELEIDISKSSLEERRANFLHISRESTKLVHSASQGHICIAVCSAWFSEYVTPEMGSVHDCYIAKVSPSFDSIERIGSESTTYAMKLQYDSAVVDDMDT